MRDFAQWTVLAISSGTAQRMLIDVVRVQAITCDHFGEYWWWCGLFGFLVLLEGGRL